jgi:F420-0:gamma-glutamyl ligase
MKVTPIKTKKVEVGDKLFDILDKYLPKEIDDKTVIAIASKIVGITEGRVVEIKSEDQRDELAIKEADYYIPREYSQYGFMITVTKGKLVASGGVDRSNSAGYYSLWPKDPQESANKIREYLIKRYKVPNMGVVITDSHVLPLQWGVTGIAIGYSGFEALNSYVGKPDLFGRIMQVERTDVRDSLATASTVVTGEGNEQTPIAIIEDLPFVKFQRRNPTKKELESLKIGFGDDVFSSLLDTDKWLKGGGGI